MAQSNAERQRRYRQRLKALAENGGNAITKLNETYNTAAAEQRDAALAEIRRKIARSKDQNFIAAMQDMVDRLPPPTYDWTLEDWCRIAALLGKADEAETVAEAEKEALRRLRKRYPPQKPHRPWAPFRHVAVPPKKDSQTFSGRLPRPSRATANGEDHEQSEPSRKPAAEPLEPAAN